MARSVPGLFVVIGSDIVHQDAQRTAVVDQLVIAYKETWKDREVERPPTSTTIFTLHDKQRGMQAALLSLGTIQSKDRIHKYISDQRHQRYEDLEHGFSCECDECSRREVLGLRRIRRNCPSARQEAEPVRTGSKRRRPKDENARRGEGKIGRVAQLRPGRITFDTVLVEEGKRLELDRQGQCDFEDATSQFNDPTAEHNWNSDEHSAHSNAVYRQTRAERLALREDQAQARKRTEQYMDGFYDRNLAATANGWLALSHHRDRGVDRRARRDAVQRAAAGLIKVQQQQLLGLVPSFRTKKPSRYNSKREYQLTE